MRSFETFFSSHPNKQTNSLCNIKASSASNRRFKALCELVKQSGLEGLYAKLDELDIALDFCPSNSDLLHLVSLDKNGRQFINDLSPDDQQAIRLSIDKEKQNVFRLNDKPVIKRHPAVKEKNGEGMEYVTNFPFQSWEKTINNTPAIIFFPKTISGLQNLVLWAKENHKRVRASGYRHTSSEMFSENDEVLVSMLDLETSTVIPAKYPKMDPNNELQNIQLVGDPFEEDGKMKINCKIGAATCNYHFQDWVHDPNRGNRKWALPLNVIMTEITFGGSNAMMCHGAGLNTKTLSDLVTEIEFVNVKGEIQTITDKEDLKAAAGCLGMLGIVTSITLKLDQMTYANFKTAEKKLLALSIPPPPDFVLTQDLKDNLSHENLAALTDPQQQQQAFNNFIEHCKNNYYVEWFWFPLQNKCWINGWNNDGKKEDAVRYPNSFNTEAQRIESYLAYLANNVLGDKIPFINKIQTKLTGTLAMCTLPDRKAITCTLEDALHFRQGIQNIKTRMMEIEIPIPDAGETGEPDWSIMQKAWWAVVESVNTAKNLELLPMRTTLEARLLGGSNITMAPQFANKRTFAIEILTPVAVDANKWEAFEQEIFDKWTALKVNIRPHFAKPFDKLVYNDGALSMPFVDYMKKFAYKDQIARFGEQIKNICRKGGYEYQDIVNTFSNPFLDNLFSNVFKMEDKKPPAPQTQIVALSSYKWLEEYVDKLLKSANKNLCKKTTIKKADDLNQLLYEIKNKSPQCAIKKIRMSLPRFNEARGITTKIFHLETTTHKKLIELIDDIGKVKLNKSAIGNLTH